MHKLKCRQKHFVGSLKEKENFRKFMAETAKCVVEKNKKLRNFKISWLQQNLRNETSAQAHRFLHKLFYYGVWRKRCQGSCRFLRGWKTTSWLCAAFQKCKCGWNLDVHLQTAEASWWKCLSTPIETHDTSLYSKYEQLLRSFWLSQVEGWHKIINDFLAHIKRVFKTIFVSIYHSPTY